MVTSGTDRALATVMFTDIVGSTEFRSRLGEDAAEDLRRTHDMVVAAAVEAHGGKVVKGLGDGALATFPDAGGAVSAAVAVQQGIDRARRSGALHPDAALRVGISAGDVTWEAGDCFGTPVVEASRLCGACDPDVILAAEVVKVLAGQRHGDRFAPAGSYELKGLPGPVGACAVQWRDEAESRPPLPPALITTGRSTFVERDAERKDLLRTWDEVVAGNTPIRLVLVSGEPGIGKTRLVQEVAAEIHEGGGTVLAGRCDEDPLLAHQPFVEALRHHVLHTPPADLRLQGGRGLAELARIVPDLPARVPGLPDPVRAEGDAERFLLFEAAADLLTGIAASAPLALLIDDLHWADYSSLLLLRHLLRRANAERILVVGTYRDTELVRTHPLADLLADLRRDGGVARVDLDGLTVSAVAILATELAHADVAPALIETIHRETEGNPFFVEETLRHLHDTGALSSDTVEATRLAVPEGVREVIGRRLSRLDEATNDVLAVAAVAGRDFELPVLEAVMEVDADRLLHALDASLAARLVQEAGPPGRYTFAHALVRETLYGELSITKRTRLHARVAEALKPLVEREPARVGEVAHHLVEAAGGVDAVEAGEWSRRAAGHAMAALAFEDAIRHCQRGLEVLDDADDELRCDLLLDLGDANNGITDYDSANHAFFAAADIARRLASPNRLARAGIGAVGPVRVRRVDPERIKLLEEALERLGEGEAWLRARALTALSLELADDRRQQKVDTAQRALAAAEATGDGALRAAALGAIYWCDHRAENLDDRSAIARQVVEVAHAAGSVETEMDGLVYVALTAWEGGDFEAADEAVARCAALVEEIPVPNRVVMVNHMTVRGLISDGRFDDAEQLAMLALQSGNESAALGVAAQLLRIRHEQGRVDELEGVMRAMAEEPNTPVVVTLALAMCLATSGRPAEALRILEPLAAGHWRGISQPGHPFRLFDLGYAALAVVALGDPQLAGSLYEQLLPYRGRHLQASMADWLGPADLFLGMLATVAKDHGSAIEHLETALPQADRSPVLTAHAQAWLAGALRARGKPEDDARVRSLLDDAAATAGRLGLALVASRVETLR